MLQKRNSEVNKLIKLAAFADDPFAEIGQADDQDGMLGASRNELFTKYKIPEVIKLSIPAFRNHAAVQIHVLATPKLAASIYMEASGVNLKWFKTACCHAWLEAADEDSSPMKRKVDIGELQIEASKVIKLKANDATKIEMYCNYKKGSGRWSKKHMSIQKCNFESEDELNEGVVKLVNRLELFHQENHVRDDDGDDAESEAGA